jgi:hypothetical protein
MFKNAGGMVNSAVFKNNRGVPLMTQQRPFKWRHFEAEIMLLCVRWYVRYSLSYRDLEEMMAERGLSVDHTTIFSISVWRRIFPTSPLNRLDSDLFAFR